MNFEFKNIEFRNFFDIDLNKYDKKAIKVSFISIAVMLLISIISTILIKLNFDGVTRINIFSILLSFHLSALKVKNMMVFSISTVKIGIIILLIVPVIVLSITNLFIYKREFDSIKECMYESFKIAFLYGMFLSVIAIFSRVKINMGIDAMFGFGYNNSTTIGYKLIYSFVNGFMIAFITSTILNWKKEFYGRYYFVDIVFSALKVFINLFVITLIITTIVSFTKNYTFSDFGLTTYSKGFGIVAYVVQIASYLMIILSGGSVEIGDKSDSLSIFSVFNKSIFMDTKLIIFIVFSIFALTMILIGSKIYKNYRNDNKKMILHFSVFYSFFISVISRFSAISISTSSIKNFSSFEIIAKSNPVLVFISAMILSMIFLNIGYKATEELEEYL